MTARTGSLRALPTLTATVGRMIVCPGCGDRVDIVEVDCGGTGQGMRPDVCGACQPIAHRLEPVIALPDPARATVGRHHADGGDTELASAHRNPPARGSQRAAVLDRLRDVGERGSTDYELYEHGIGARPHVPATRREELIADGWPIRDTGERRATDTGSPAIVWRLDES